MHPIVQRAARASPPEDYTAADIEVLEGLEPVRRRPGMFIGGTDERALHHLAARAVDGVWIHLDVDVLDDEVMPAVDYRLPDGVSWSDAEMMLTRAWQEAAIGMDVTIFNPRLDPGGTIVRSLVEWLVRILTPERGEN